jgi:hypothetical protein
LRFQPAPHGVDHLASDGGGVGDFGLDGFDALIALLASFGFCLSADRRFFGLRVLLRVN